MSNIIKMTITYRILAVNFWSVTYFSGFNFGTSYLGAKIGQNKTMIDKNHAIPIKCIQSTKCQISLK
jgi:hypothetical protein